jgi:hypothetical protein
MTASFPLHSQPSRDQHLGLCPAYSSSHQSQEDLLSGGERAAQLLLSESPHLTTKDLLSDWNLREKNEGQSLFVKM